MIGTRAQRAIAIGIVAMVWEKFCFDTSPGACLLMGLFATAVWYVLPSASGEP